MEEKEKKFKFFRTVLKREPNLIYLDSWIRLNPLTTFDNSRVWRYTITKMNCKIIGAITDIKEIVEKDLIGTIDIFNTTNNTKICHGLQFKEWNYPEIVIDDEFRYNVRMFDERVDDKNYWFSGKDEVDIFDVNNGSNYLFLTLMNNCDKELALKIFNIELNYGRKRKKSITDNRPTV